MWLPQRASPPQLLLAGVEKRLQLNGSRASLAVPTETIGI
jgi:hypothetical protein